MVAPVRHCPKNLRRDSSDLSFMTEAADLLAETLEEEKAADEKLSGLAETVNPMAAHKAAA